MVKKVFVLFALCMLVLVSTSIEGSCGQKKIPGNIAGQVVTAFGQGIGNVQVVLIDVGSHKETQRQNAENIGNFWFRDVEAGTYTIELYDITGNEVPIDAPLVKLGVGRTIVAAITMKDGLSSNFYSPFLDTLLMRRNTTFSLMVPRRKNASLYCLGIAERQSVQCQHIGGNTLTSRTGNCPRY